MGFDTIGVLGMINEWFLKLFLAILFSDLFVRHKGIK